MLPHQSGHTSEINKSPLQAKKRVCNYNNDITSSLSSSIKRRDNEKKRDSNSPNHAVVTNSDSYEIQNAKVQRLQDCKNNTQTTIRLENMANNLRKIETVKPISPLPKTPCVQNEDIPHQRCTYTHPYNSNEAVSMDTNPQTNKQRLTLFNKKYEEDVGDKDAVLFSSENVNELSSCDECAGIPFVKPKKISISGLKNPIMERTQKSKLALMLSGLKGELYRDPETDKVDSPSENKEKPKDNNSVENAVTTMTSVTTTTATQIAVTSCSNSGSKASNITSLPTGTLTSAKQTNTSVNNTSSPLVGLKLSHTSTYSENGIAPKVNDSKTTNKTPIPKLQLLGEVTGSITTSVSTMVSTTSDSSGLSSLASTIKSPICLGNNSESFIPPMSTNTPVSVNPPVSNDKSFSLPVISTNLTNTNTSVNTSKIAAKLPNSITLVTNITSSTTTSNNNTTTPFNFLGSSHPQSFTTVCSSPVIFRPLPSSTISTSTASLSKALSITTNNMTFGTVTTTSNMTNATSTTTVYSFNQTKTSLPGLVTSISSSNSATKAFTFGAPPSTTTVSEFGANNNLGITTQEPSSPFSFDLQSKTPDSNSGDKINSNVTNKSTNNSFNSNSSLLFGAPSLSAPATAAAFGNSANNTESNIFGATNLVSTSVFGSNSINNNKQIFGSNSESKPSVFGGPSTNNSPSTTFSFCSKPISTNIVNNNSSTKGGFSFESSFSKISDGGMFGIGNASKPTTTANTSNNIFGTVSTASPENKSFVFGANSGASNKTSDTLTAAGGFSFNSTAVEKTPTFNFGTTGNSFSPSNGPNNNSASAFSFGVTASPKPGETPSNKPFSFGAVQTDLHQSSMQISNNGVGSSNIFASSGPLKITNPQAFTFNSGNSTSMQSVGQQTSNIFAPPLPNIATGPEKRQIRRATRRLQK